MDKNIAAAEGIRDQGPNHPTVPWDANRGENRLGKGNSPWGTHHLGAQDQSHHGRDWTHWPYTCRPTSGQDKNRNRAQVNTYFWNIENNQTLGLCHIFALQHLRPNIRSCWSCGTYHIHDRALRIQLPGHVCSRRWVRYFRPWSLLSRYHLGLIITTYWDLAMVMM